MNDMAYATGAHPDYNPQMAESIVVYSNEVLSAALLGAKAAEADMDRLVWTILWTDTDGRKHGRRWSYSRKVVQGVGLKEAFPLVCASTQAGCVWIWKQSTETWAEIQQSHDDYDRYPRIPIQQFQKFLAIPDLEWERIMMPDGPGEPRVWIGEGQ